MSSVFVNKRPIRFVFLVDPRKEDWPEQLDAVWNYNLDKWGGRFNPIIPTNGSEISPDWWRFFKKLDPDYVVATSTISDGLRNEINAEICPIDVELPRSNQSPDLRPNIFTYNDTISVAPISQTLAKLSRIPYPLPPPPQMANLRCDDTADDTVRRFVIRNFGYYPNIVYWNGVLDKIARLAFSLSTRGDLVKALTELSRPELKVVYPIQVSSLDGPVLYLDYEHEHSHDVFGLIVGDTFEEQLFSWNKVLYGRTDAQSHRLTHLWLPTAFANDAELMETLGRWLRKMTEHVHLFSFSVSQDELCAIGERLDTTRETKFVLRSALHKSLTSLTSFPFPKFAQPHAYSFWDRFSYALSPPKEADHYRASALNEEFEIRGPAMGQELRPTGSWMADVFIEADNTRFYAEKVYLRLDTPFWWQLPRKNYLATQIFGVQARIDSRGVPTIQLPARNPQLRFMLPNERELLARCVQGDIHGKMQGLVKRKNSDIKELGFSNIGKYLSGFLEVFGGLAFAHDVLSERYWRRMFERLSGNDAQKDENLSARVQDKLPEIIREDRTDSEKRGNLAEYVIQLAKEVSRVNETLELKDFFAEAQLEHDEFKTAHNVDWQFDENSVKASLSKMLELGVIQMGFAQNCPRCGTDNWYLIDEVRQRLVCVGCRYSFSIPAEPEISYRLNSLVRRGIFAHGIVPVVLVLGQILKDSRSSFFYSPSLDFTTASGEKGDLDIVCIQDGRLVIGEVKKGKKFRSNQAVTLAKVAAAADFDILLFSSLKGVQTQNTRELISEAQKELEGTRVQVGWYQLSKEIFKPTRMDY